MVFNGGYRAPERSFQAGLGVETKLRKCDGEYLVDRSPIFLPQLASISAYVRIVHPFFKFGPLFHWCHMRVRMPLIVLVFFMRYIRSDIAVDTILIQFSIDHSHVSITELRMKLSDSWVNYVVIAIERQEHRIYLAIITGRSTSM